MRIAAGILMIIYSVRTIALMGDFLSYFLSEQAVEYSPLFLATIISAVFIITGGVFCLKRKYWKICFASSIVILGFTIFDLLFLLTSHVPFGVWPNLPIWVLTLLTVPWPILPIIFVLLRKREWSESQA